MGVRLQMSGRGKHLDILDGVGVWFYPLLYIGALPRKNIPGAMFFQLF